MFEPGRVVCLPPTSNPGMCEGCNYTCGRGRATDLVGWAAGADEELALGQVGGQAGGVGDDEGEVDVDGVDGAQLEAEHLEQAALDDVGAQQETEGITKPVVGRGRRRS